MAKNVPPQRDEVVAQPSSPWREAMAKDAATEFIWATEAYGEAQVNLYDALKRATEFHTRDEMDALIRRGLTAAVPYSRMMVQRLGPDAIRAAAQRTAQK